MSTQRLKEKIASILEIPTEHLDIHIPLTSYGIDSLKAIEIQSFVESEWSVRCNFEHILNDLTTSDLFATLAEVNEDLKKNIAGPGPEKTHFYPLSYQQTGIKRFNDTSSDKTPYNIGKAIAIQSEIDQERLALSINKVMDLHPCLRTCFIKNGLKDEQKIEAHCPSPFRYFSTLPSENLEQFLDDCALEAFDLEHAPLFRAILIRLAPKSYIFLVVFHHIVADLWSTGIFFKQLFQTYHSLDKGHAPLSSHIEERSYKDFVQHQSDYLLSEKGIQDLNFWIQECQGEDYAINLPYDKPKQVTPTYRGGHRSFILSEELSRALKDFAKAQKTTPYICLLATFELLIHFYSGRSNFFVGTTLPGRPYSRWHECIGIFANILPIKVQIGSMPSFSSFVKEVNTRAKRLFEHGEMPFTYLLDQLSQRGLIRRDNHLSPIFQTMFVYQQVPSFENDVNAIVINSDDSKTSISKYGIDFHSYSWNIPVSPFELTLFMNESRGRFHGCFEFNSTLFESSTIALMSQQFVHLLHSLLSGSAISPSLMQVHKNTPLAPAHHPDQSQTLISLFRTLSQSYPHHIIASDKGNALTVQKADTLSNLLAGIFLDYGIQPGQLVAVLMDHSPELLIALLAILKLGAIILPLDPHIPEERLKNTLEESGAVLLIADDPRTLNLMKNVFILDQASLISLLKNGTRSSIPIVSYGDQFIAYIIYTSGSTGKPKGIAVSHRALISYLQAIIRQYKIPEGSHWALHSPISFDLTLTSLFLPLVGKHTLHLFSRENDDPFATLQEIIAHPLISHLKLTPSHLKYMQEIDHQPTSLKQLIVGGESLTMQLVESIWKQYGQKIEIINEYGPTEATIGAIFGIFPDHNFSSFSSMLVDKCLDNADYLICDTQLNQLPPLISGELLLSGQCLSLGYWNRPDLTAQAFIPHPLKTGQRMYRTGDLVRKLSNGHLLLLGRIDRQIKIHGFRIECEEIEQKILSYPAVKKCAIALYDKTTQTIISTQNNQADPILCAYVVPKNPLDLNALKQYLLPLLPHYMHPARFVICDDFSLSINGKIDFAKLPHPLLSPSPQEEGKRLPQTALQQQLVEIWSAVLHLKAETISIDQHFFELGGDSISVIELVGKCKLLDVHFTPKTLYDHPTIELLANFLETSTLPQPALVSNQSYPQIYALAPIQKRFFNTPHPAPHHYNQAIILSRREGFDIQVVNRVLTKLINHHDNLRSVFIQDGKTIVGKVGEMDIVTSWCTPFETASEAEVLKSLQERLDIQKGPLICAGLYRKGGRDTLLIVIHHLLIDGVSWRILLEDFDNLYAAALKGQSDTAILHRTHSYPSWVEQLTYNPNESQHWSSFFNTLSSSQYRVASRKSLHFTLPNSLSSNLLSRKQSLRDTLLTALCRALPLCTKSQRNTVLLESHGRESHPHLDLTRSIGWFTALFPVCLEDDVGKSLAVLEKQIQHMIAQIPNTGLNFQLFADESKNMDLPAICFNYLGHFNSKDYKTFEATPVLEGMTAPANLTPHHLEILAYVSNGTFHITILFDDTTHDEKSIRAFETLFQDLLATICLDTPELQAPVTPLQHGILFEELRFPGKYYIEQARLEFSGEFSEKNWKQAFGQLISQSEALKTRFVHEGLEHPLQMIQGTLLPELHIHDISTLEAEKQDLFIQETCLKDKQTAFNLSTGPLMRLNIIRTNKDRFLLLWSFHHIILDGWSLAILFKHLIDHLEHLHSLREMTSIPLLAFDYSRYLSNLDRKASRSYFQTLLEGYLEPSQLPKSLSDEASIPNGLEEVSFVITPTQVQKLQHQAQSHHITLSTLIQTSWGILLANYSGCSDVVFGMVDSGRSLPLPNIGSMVGLFIATLPVRMIIDQKMAFHDLCKQTQRQVIETQQNVNISLAEIQAISPHKQNLFDHILIFENYPLSGKAQEMVQGKNLPFTLLSAELQEEVPYNLTITVLPGASYEIRIKYNQRSFTADLINRLAKNWQILLDQVADDASKPIKHLNYLTPEELDEALSINHTTVQYPVSCVHSFFETQHKQTPDRIAVIFEDQHVSYHELNKRASILALYLQNQGLGPEDLVGILMDKSIDMVVCWLGILKAGCGYVPLNINDPQDRLEEIIKEAHLSLVLSHTQTLLTYPVPKLCLDKWECIEEIALGKVNKGTDRALVCPQNLAYVIHTSGSTGKPKGIAMEHQAVVNHSQWLTQLLSISRFDRILQCTDFSFDITICSFYGLFVGGVVILVPPEACKSMTEIYQCIKREKISLAQIGASLLSTMVQEEIFDSRHQLRYLLTGGSPLKREIAAKWYRLTDTPIMNLYGPTETCIDATYYQIPEADKNGVLIPIGQPIDNDQAFILNPLLDICPLHVTGELHIGGHGLARGYHRKPDATAAAFLPHLYDPAKRMYKTGDRCSLNSEKTLILHGRFDHQVKIRGLRVELKEIENVICGIEGVKEAFIRLYGENSYQKIIAYVCAESSVNEKMIRELLSQKLPAHMLPSHFVFLASFPLNERQKIDIQKLPLPTFERTQTSIPMTLNAAEKHLQDMWARVLGIDAETIYADSNFFDLGGNSLGLMQLQAQIYKNHGKTVPIESFFLHPSIKSYARFLNGDAPTQLETHDWDEKKNRQSEYRSRRKAQKERMS